MEWPAVDPSNRSPRSSLNGIHDSWMLPIPATFVVGKGGRINYRRRMAIENLIDALE